MDKVAAAFSWIVGIGRVIYFWFLCFIPSSTSASSFGGKRTSRKEEKFLPAFAPSFFCSLIGGILTICIPEADLYGYQGYMASKIFDEEGEKKELSEDEKIELIAKYKKLLDEGAITQEDFEAKKKDLLQ